MYKECIKVKTLFLLIVSDLLLTQQVETNVQPSVLIVLSFSDSTSKFLFSAPPPSLFSHIS